ncbi:MAG: FAD-binding protein [Rickettsiales bacterium]
MEINAVRALVVAEIIDGAVADATKKAVSAGLAVAPCVDVMMMDERPERAAASASLLQGVARVYALKAKNFPYPTAERVAAQIAALAKKNAYAYVIAPANGFGKDVLPRAAALCGSYAVTDVIAVLDGHTFKRPTYAGGVIEVVRAEKAELTMLTVRPTCFPLPEESRVPAEIIAEDAREEESVVSLTRFMGVDGASDKKADLTTAKTVISGGRGIGSAEGFDRLRALAEKIDDCAVGASRAAVDSGYATNDMQVGQTGKIVAPELYLAIGISGAAQHLAGMKDSRIVAAVNKDDNAPIFEATDVGLVADLFDVLPELEKRIVRP